MNTQGEEFVHRGLASYRHLTPDEAASLAALRVHATIALSFGINPKIVRLELALAELKASSLFLSRLDAQEQATWDALAFDT